MNERDSSYDAVRLQCEELNGLDQLQSAEGPKDFIYWFGEVHGSVEAPAMFEDFICSKIDFDKKVLVALELPVNEDLQRGFGAPDPEEYWKSLASWQQFGNDGRHSQAILELLNRLRQYTDNGADIEVAGIDLSPEQWFSLSSNAGRTRGSVMAQNLASVAAKYSQIFVLTGNVNSSKKESAALPPAASLYTERPIYSLGLTFDGGEIWACIEQECGGQQIDRHWRMFNNSQPRQIVFNELSDSGYDASLHLGWLSISYPAVDSFVQTE